MQKVTPSASEGWMFDHVFSVPEVTHYTGILPDSVREQRKRGIIHGIGAANDRGHWKYSLYDMVTLAISKSIHVPWFNRTDLVQIGNIMARDVINRKMGHDYVMAYAFWKEKYVLKQAAIRNIKDFSEIDAVVKTIVLVDRLADTLPTIEINKTSATPPSSRP